MTTRLFQERILDILADYELSTRTFADTWIAVHELDNDDVSDAFESFVVTHIDSLTLTREKLSGLSEDELIDAAREYRSGVGDVAKTVLDLGYDDDIIVSSVFNHLAAMSSLGFYPKAFERLKEELDAEIDMRQC